MTNGSVETSDGREHASHDPNERRGNRLIDSVTHVAVGDGHVGRQMSALN
jgi:hypothetical protein